MSGHPHLASTSTTSNLIDSLNGSKPTMSEQQPFDLRTIPERWCAAWSQDDFSKWISLYTADAQYTDHAFRLNRSTHHSLNQHFSVWRNAQPDFVMVMSTEYPVYWSDNCVDSVARVIFRTTNTGTNLRDTPMNKASGKRFSFLAVVELTIRKEDGLIQDVQEWYSRDFNSWVPEDGYIMSK